MYVCTKANSTRLFKHKTLKRSPSFWLEKLEWTLVLPKKLLTKIGKNI